jgi:hypothetical protein
VRSCRPAGLQKTLDYPRSTDADCKPILQSSTRFAPGHCSYGFNSFSQRNNKVQNQQAWVVSGTTHHHARH